MRAPRLTETLDDYLAVRLSATGAVARRELEREYGPIGRPLREALLVVSTVDRPCISPGGLADRLGLQRSEVGRVLRGLHAAGFLEIRASRRDGRSLAVEPLERGERLAEAALPALAAVERRLRQNITPLRQEQLATCLELLKGPRTPVAEALLGL